MQEGGIIEIPSSPESSMHIPAIRTLGKPRIPAAAKGKTPIRRRPRREPVIELTDSEADDHKFAPGPSNSGSSWTIPSSSSHPRSDSQTLQPKMGGSSGSLDNIPLHRRQEKTPTQPRAFPLFLESDQENEPPVQVAGPAIAPPQEPQHAPVPAPGAMRVDPVPDEVFVPLPIDVPAPVEEEKDQVSTVVAQVLEIIPDVHPDHLLALVEQHLPTHQAQVLEHVLHILFEDASYPKVEKKAKGKRKVEAEEDPAPAKKAKIDYGSTERQFQRGRHYVDLSLNQLQADFPYIPKPYLRRQLALHNTLYAPTYLFLSAQEKRLQKQDNQDIWPYSRKVTPFKAAKGKGKAVLTEDPQFEAERAWILEQSVEGKGGKVQEEGEEEEYEDNGDGIECGCCFSTYPFEKIVQCPEAHLFCISCISTYASSKLGAHDADLVCVHQSGCKLPFPSSELRRFLPEKLMSLYERVKQQKEVEAAGLEGLEECPFCEWKCVIENEQERLFRCGNEEGGCGVVSCRGCKKVDHLPKSCKEMEEDKHLDGRHAIEEAMTRALMRNCPKCQKAFIKEMGCNKMTCPNCHTLSCYICRQVIKGYDHFNQAPPGHPSGSTNNKCILWDPVEQRHADEVKEAAEKALAQYKLDHPEADEEQIKVDLPVAPPPPVQPHGYNNMGMQQMIMPIPPMLPVHMQMPMMYMGDAARVGVGMAGYPYPAMQMEAERHRMRQQMAQANIRAAQGVLDRELREVAMARRAEEVLLLEEEAAAARGRAGGEVAGRVRVARMRMGRDVDDALVQMRRQRVMERAAAEVRVERARDAVNAARAVAAEFELDAGRQGEERRRREAEERERLRAAAVAARLAAKPRAKRARRR